MNRLKISAWLIMLLISFQTSFVLSQDTIVSHSIPEIVVTATRTEKNADSVGRSITVISEDAIKKSGATDLAALLSNYAGISIIGANQNPGMTESIFMRGVNSNQTVIMIDNIPINDPSSVNRAIDLTELPLSNIEQIEIVRGSHSTLYGSSAIGGAINIITKKNDKPGLSGDGSIMAGTFGNNTFQLEEKLFLNYTFKNGFYANLDLFNTNINGLDATVDTVTSSSDKNYDDDDFNQQRGSAKLGYRKNKWDVFAAYSYLQQAADFDKHGFKHQDFSFPGTWYDGDSTRIFTKRHLFNYSIGFTASPVLNFQLQGGYTDLDRTTVDDSSYLGTYQEYDHTWSDGHYTGSEMNHELLVNYRAKNILVTGGAGWQQETMNTLTHYYNSAFQFELVSDLDSLDLQASTYNAFLQLDIAGSSLSENLSNFNLILGSRYNYHDMFGSLLTWEINPSFKLGTLALIYGSYSSGFNAPSLYQLYAPDVYYTSDITRGTPDLLPEFSESIEGGVKFFLKKNIRAGLAIHTTTVRNAIEYVYLWDKNIPISELGTDFYRDDFRGDTYINAGKQITWGGEVYFSADISKAFSIDGNFSLIKGKQSYTPDDIDSVHTEGNHVQLYNNGVFPTTTTEREGLVRRPSTANLGLTFRPVSKGSIRLNTKWVSSYDDIYYDNLLGPYGALNTIPLDDYFLFDLLLNYDFTKNISASFTIQNMLDTKYTEIRGFTTRGSGFYLALRASF